MAIAKKNEYEPGITSWVPIGLAILSGWNIAVFAWFLMAVGAAALMSQFQGSSVGAKFLFLGLFVLLAAVIGYLGGKKLYPKFKSLSGKWQVAWLVILLIITAIFFPKPFTYVVS